MDPKVSVEFVLVISCIFTHVDSQTTAESSKFEQDLFKKLGPRYILLVNRGQLEGIITKKDILSAIEVHEARHRSHSSLLGSSLENLLGGGGTPRTRRRRRTGSRGLGGSLSNLGRGVGRAGEGMGEDGVPLVGVGRSLDRLDRGDK